MKERTSDIQTKEEKQRSKDLTTALKSKKVTILGIEKLNVEEVIANGQKWYQYGDRKVGSSYLQLYGQPNEIYLKKWLEALRYKLWETYSDMLVFIIFETENNVTYQYQIMSDCIKLIATKGILSREKDIMPLIEARYLENSNTEKKTQELVKRLSKEHKTIATMESCTGGELASTITSVEGASEILKESYVSYCNEAKIKFGVPKDIIEQYTVYSAETAIAMAKAVSNLAKSDIGIGITGQLGRIDPDNPGCENNSVWYAIKQGDEKSVYKLLIFEDFSRSAKKEIVTREIIESLYRK